MSRQPVAMHQLPPIELPVGYFRAAPWFGIAAGLLLLWAGESAWATRWAPAALGATHLLVLGCMAMVMMGALVQVLPVVSAASVPGASTAAPFIRTGLGIGAAALSFGLLREDTAALAIAGGVLLLTFAGYLVPLVGCLVRRIGGGDTVFGIRVAVACLVATVVLGLLLVVGHLRPDLVPGYRGWTGLHLGCGLAGWIAVLILSVSYQIIPMFHVAPDYPAWLARALPLATLVGIALTNPWVLGGVGLTYATTTLYLLHRRKRRVPDPTVWFWQLAMVLLVAAVACLWIVPARELLVGVLFLFGFALTVMVGMLYKIVPFLVFTHLQRACLRAPSRIAELPRMDRIIPAARARYQLALHLVTVATCVAAALVPAMGVVAAGAMVANFAWLLGSIWTGHRCFRQLAERFATTPATPTTPPAPLRTPLTPLSILEQ